MASGISLTSKMLSRSLGNFSHELHVGVDPIFGFITCTGVPLYVS